MIETDAGLNGQTETPAAETVNPKRKRVWEVDALRGFLILFVVFDHLMWDVGYYFNRSFGTEFMRSLVTFARSYWTGSLRTATHGFFVGGFVVLSGISTAFSKNNFTKAIRVLLFAFLLTWITVLGAENGISSYNELIVFGVLHMLGFSGLIYALLEKVKTPWWALLAFAAVCLGLGYYFNANPAMVKASGNVFSRVAAALINTDLGGAFSPGDYFALLPWLGWFLAGAVAGKFLYKEKRSLLPKFNEKYVAPLSFCGRYSLWIYFIGQIAGIGLITLFINLGWM